MSSTRLDPNVVSFLVRYIASVGELDVLLLLHADPSRTWTAKQVGTELRSNEGAAATQLDKLTRSGLLAREGTATFRYAPGAPELGDTVGHVARLYPEWRSTYIATIYDPSLRNISAFSDAFKIRKDGE